MQGPEQISEDDHTPVNSQQNLEAVTQADDQFGSEDIDVTLNPYSLIELIAG